MNIDYLAAAGQLVSLLDAASITASANGTGVDVSAFMGQAAVLVNVNAPTAGTSPTFDYKLQSSADNSTNWTDVPGAAITQVTSTKSLQKIVFNPDTTNKYVRGVVTIGGTASPAFPASASLIGLKQ